MERGRSVPASMAPNPFWSARTRDEIALQRMRPEGLPVVPATPEEDLHSLDGLGPSKVSSLFAWAWSFSRASGHECQFVAGGFVATDAMGKNPQVWPRG